MKVGENALTEFLDVLIEWETAIVDKLLTNRPIKRISFEKRGDNMDATEGYNCRHAFETDDLKRPKVRDNDLITGFFRCSSTPVQLGA